MMHQFLPVTATAANQRCLPGGLRYSICTLVSDTQKYAQMLQSFEAGGFTTADCEFLYLDNTETNLFDAYIGINIFLRTSQGAYAIICHQDVELIEDGMHKLDKVIRELDAIDPAWGMFGNAGALEGGGRALRISDPHGENQNVGGIFPIRVATLDENFIVVRQEANLAVSRDLTGFHLYGTELALVANRLGCNVYVVDFHLRHRGRGIIDDSFYTSRQALIDKCKTACRWRWLTTPCTEIPVMSSTVLHCLAASKPGAKTVKFLMKMHRWLVVSLGLESRTNLTRPGGSSSSDPKVTLR